MANLVRLTWFDHLKMINCYQLDAIHLIWSTCIQHYPSPQTTCSITERWLSSWKLSTWSNLLNPTPLTLRWVIELRNFANLIWLTWSDQLEMINMIRSDRYNQLLLTWFNQFNTCLDGWRALEEWKVRLTELELGLCLAIHRLFKW